MNLAPDGRLFRFYCDESYDDKHYAVVGIFSDESTWCEVEKRWASVNAQFQVKQYHASYLNGKRGEYTGWDDAKKIAYSKELLKIITDQGPRMHIVACGMMTDKYETIISAQGREKLGSSYLACFKTCVALMAKEMDEGGFPVGDKFSVIFDRNEKDGSSIVKAFCNMRGDKGFAHRLRLHDCQPSSMEETPRLQPADMAAYEVFKRMRDRGTEKEMRVVLSDLFGKNGVSERLYDVLSLTTLKTPIENTPCAPNELVIIPA